MKKFKLITTCASLILMLALVVFGVYAAGQAISFSVNGTINYTVSDVYIKVASGKWNDSWTDLPAESTTYYYSKPENGQNNILGIPKDLGGANFADADAAGGKVNKISYYVYIESLQGQPIYLRLKLNWVGNSKYKANALTADGAVSISAIDKKTNSQNVAFRSDLSSSNPSEGNGVRTDNIVNDTGSFEIMAKSTRLYVITLTMSDDAMIYKSEGKLTIDVGAGLTSDEVNSSFGN